MATNTYYQGGSLIPGAGTYLQDQAKALSAYDDAVMRLKTTRSQQQIQSGLGNDWQVDPFAQYGTYQQMLGQQGGQLDQNQESNQQRGFFGSGLGNQGEGAIRYGNAVQSLGFQNSLSNWENQYQQGLVDAKRTQDNSNLGSMQGAYNDAVDQGDYPVAPDPTQQAPQAQAAIHPLVPHLPPTYSPTGKVQLPYYIPPKPVIKAPSAYVNIQSKRGY
jgi:hypothetical protein